jgi:hydroxymethylbilane synthase
VRELEIRIGTRGSALALAQATLAGAALEAAGGRVRLVVVPTAGDRRAPDTAWGEGAFVTALEAELLAGRIDMAVHSAKDVPTAEDPRLRIGAYLARADPRDALVVGPGLGPGLADLPPGARIGTDSPRRTGFLLARRPDLDVRPLHGNVDTRLRRLEDGEVDALVLACAGLDRLGMGDRIAERIDPEVIPPAPGQGALALQVRADDADLRLLGTIDDAATRLAVEAERSFLAASGGGCRAPIGALATIRDDGLDLLGGYVRVDGSRARLAHAHGPMDRGGAVAADLVDMLRRTPSAGPSRVGSVEPDARPRVLVTRAADQARSLLAALRAAGLEPLHVPAIAVQLEPGGGELDAALRHLVGYAWVVVTSANGARAVLRGAERVFTPFEASRWAGIGNVTRAVLEREGVDLLFQPARSTSAAMAEELPVVPGDRILLVRGDLASPGLPSMLRARGAVVDDVIAYRTIEGPASSGPLLHRAFRDGPLDAAVFTSGSTVRGLLELAWRESIDVLRVPAVCIGPETAVEAGRAGFRIAAVSTSTDAWAMADATARVIDQAAPPAAVSQSAGAGAVV